MTRRVGELGFWLLLAACENPFLHDLPDPSPTTISSDCGDGATNGLEKCDDGNEIDGDGCDRNCTPTGCGNGIQTEGEECDDGNANDRDACLNSCRNAICGDGVLREDLEEGDEGYEECDLGPLNADDIADRCRTNCRQARCGDGMPDTGEGCDDGNGDNSDSCPDGPGGTCQHAICGDGHVFSKGEGTETCDDNNHNNADSCPDDVGGTCQHARCGDGYTWTVGGSEVCDDGYADDCGTCNKNCTGPGTGDLGTCGDGIACEESGETCDDGYTDECGACNADCTGAGTGNLGTCGDGIVCEETGETCDDDNVEIGDGCDDHCHVESGWECDGIPSLCCGPAAGSVIVPAGPIMMGCAADGGDDDCDEDGENDDEKPSHQIFLDVFCVDIHEVTASEYKDCVDDEQCAYSYDGPSLNETYDVPGMEDHPINYVSWDEAATYCQWKGMMLPTEAEWEKAARGTNGRKFPWGNAAAACEYAVMDGCGATISAVGSKPAGASPYGAMDMAGNVWEWVADWYYDEYYESSPVSNPQGPTTGTERVLRGAFFFDKSYLRSSDRHHDSPSKQSEYYGFRCVLRPQ